MSDIQGVTSLDANEPAAVDADTPTEPVSATDDRPPEVGSKNPTERTVYLIECFRLAHAEGMARNRSRDSWLRLQLIAQVAILAVFQGIEIGGVKPVKALPDILAASALVSAVCYSMYTSENSLIGHLSKYVASLSLTERKLNGGELIVNWDASQDYRSRYIQSTLPIRTIVQGLSFIGFPLAISVFRVTSHTPPWTTFFWVETAMNASLLLYCLYLLRRNHIHRKTVIQDINPS